MKSLLASAKIPALLFLIAFVICWKLFLSPEYTFLASPDNSRQTYPWSQYIAAHIHRGVFPFWDNTVDAGRTFIGELQTGAFYPLNLLMAALPLNPHGRLPIALIEGFVVLHFFLASLCMYLLARSFRLSPFASLVAGLAYAYSGSLAFGQINLFYACVWVPLVFLFAFRAWRSESWRRALLFCNLGGLFLALCLLAGHHQPCLYAGFALILTTLFLLPESRRHAAQWGLPSAGSRLRILSVPVLVFLFFCGYASVQLIPSFEYSRLAYRWYGDGFVPASSPVPYSHAGTDANLNPGAFLNFLFPYFGPVDTSPYFGILALLFCLYAAAACVRNRVVRWCLFLAGSFLILAMGGFTPIHGLSYFLIPGMGKAREAARALLIVHFGLSLSAAFGVEALLRPATRDSLRLRGKLTRVIWSAALFVSAVLFTLSFYKAGVLGQYASYDGPFWICLLLIAGAGIAAARHYSLLRPSSLKAIIGIALICDYYAYLESDFQLKSAYDGRSNLYPAQHYREDGVLRFLADAKKPFRVEFRNDLYPPNTGEVYGLETLNSYSATALQSYRELVSSDYSAGGIVHDLLNIKYVVSSESLALPKVYEERGRKIYENPHARPRAWLVRRLIQKPGETPLEAALKDPAFNPAESALIPPSMKVPSSWDHQGAVFFAPNPSAEAVVLGYDRDSSRRIRVRVRTGSPALLVLSEIWYPGWRVTVNGSPAPVFSVDGALRGVFVREGESQVEFSYLPSYFYLGLAAECVALLLLLVWMWLERFHRRDAGHAVMPCQKA